MMTMKAEGEPIEYLHNVFEIHLGVWIMCNIRLQEISDSWKNLTPMPFFINLTTPIDVLVAPNYYHAQFNGIQCKNGYSFQAGST